MSIRMLDEDDALRDLPCLILAVMAHAALLSSPALRGTSRPRPAPASIAVDFVEAVPAPAEPAPTAALAPVKAAPAAKASGGPLASRTKTRKPAARAKVPNLARALARRQAAAAAAQAAVAVARERAERVEAARELRANQERHRVEARQRLATLVDPDEKLSDAVASGPTAAAKAPTTSFMPAQAAPMGATKDAVYDGDDAPGAGAAGGDGAGGASWSLDGPAGTRRLLSRILPASPAWLSERGLDLSVQIKFQVLPDGSVKRGAVVKKTSGFPEVDRAALEALARWRFAPARGGVETWGVVTFRFLPS